MSGSSAIQAFIVSKQANRKQRTLTKDEQKRLTKLEEILVRLRRKENVQNRTLQTWLTTSEYDEIEERWDEQKQLRAELKDKPDVLVRYEKMLQKALFTHNRADGMNAKGNSAAAGRLRNVAETQFEDALEYLHENVTLDPSLMQWLDRDVDMSPDSGLGLSPVGMPRVITSRSLDQLSGGVRYVTMTKLEVKQAVVEQAIGTLKYEQ